MSISQSVADFIAILVDKHHGNLRKSLPQLLQLAPAWERLHGHTQTPTSQWSKLLGLWWGEVEQHLDKEEAFIFPACMEGRGPHLGAQLQTLEQEHKDHRQMMEALTQSLENGVDLLTQCLRQPAEDVPFLEGAIAFHQEATQMLEQLQEHIDLENRVLFPLVLGLDNPVHWEVGQTPNSPN
jgi:iron-sulfur cluster repair protein YtfE (RIC family)